MRRRPIALALLGLVAPLLVTVTVPPDAVADPVPALFTSWPLCGTGGDDDGRYCIVSQTADGVPVGTTVPASGTFERPYVDLLDAGTVRYGIDVFQDGEYQNTASNDPDVLWEITVNSGSIRPRELYGIIRDPVFVRGGSAASGWTFTISFRPTPVAWRDFDLPCGPGDCGDDTTVADLVYDGFVTGYVSDLTNPDREVPYTPAEIEQRTGAINTWNADEANYFYDAETNAIVVRLANPHLKAPGEVATGFFETFLPDGQLLHEMGVPYPESLSGASLRVTRNGGSTPVPIEFTREAGGIRIRIDGITFSSPTYRIKPKPSKPGTPRRVKATKPSPTTAKVTYRFPIADGGSDITRYAGRCRNANRIWSVQRAVRGPITFERLRPGKVTCQVRAMNKIGPGRWSSPVSS